MSLPVSRKYSLIAMSSSSPVTRTAWRLSQNLSIDCSSELSCTVFHEEKSDIIADVLSGPNASRNNLSMLLGYSIIIETEG